MTVHRFDPTTYHRTFGSHDGVLTLASRDGLLTTTVDASGRDERGERVTDPGNPLTGPFLIDGAEPGDTLVVRVRSVRPNRPTGFSSAALAPVTVDPAYVWELERTDRRIDWQVDMHSCTARPSKPIIGLEGFQVPVEPMLGCIGVAPEAGQAISTATSGRHGGNMDYRGIRAGVTLRFPVLVPGALLFVGDVHAAQGAGELTGTGIEISADIELEVGLERGVRPEDRVVWPRGETDTVLFTMGNARPLDQAAQHATTEMVRWLRGRYGLSIEAASVLIGQACDYDLGNMFDPAYTMVCVLEKRYLPTAT
ncbi:MAG: acetamidase [Trueperaceae bacterium]|nr:MAG: acetamidase [Trueperaceae bacterium]